MIYTIRYRLAYLLMDWGLRLIPNPYVRARFEQANQVAAETLMWEAERDERESMAD